MNLFNKFSIFLLCFGLATPATADTSVRGSFGFSQRDGVVDDAWSKTAWGLGLDFSVAPKITLGVSYLAKPKGIAPDTDRTFMKSDRFYVGADYWLKDYFSVGMTAGLAWENWGSDVQEFSKNPWTLGSRVRFEIPLSDNSFLGSETDFVWYLNSNFDGVAFTNSAYLRMNF
jgi:opacity protein-like surface antigen